MPKVKKKMEERRVNYVAKENTRKKGAELVSSFYNEDMQSVSNSIEDKPRSSSFFDEDRARSESGSFNSNPFTNIFRTPSPDILSESVQLIENENKKECSLQTTPKNKRNLSSRLSSRSRGSFLNHSRSHISPLYFSSERMKKYKGDCNLPVEDNIALSEGKEENKENICETPKIRYDSFNLTKRDANFEVVNINIHEFEKKITEKVCFARTKSHNEIMHLQGIVNINPYLDYQPAQIKSNKENVNELSFFTRDLLESKAASTPIHAVNEKVPTKLAINDISNASSMTNKTRNRKDSVFRRSALTSIIIEEPLPKQIDVDDEIKVERKVTEFLSNTAPVGELRATEKISKIATVLNKGNKPTYESLLEDTTSRDDTLGAMKKVLKNVHKYGAVTAKWTMSLFSVCMRLGFSIKPKIESTPCTHTEDLETIKTCTCNHHQAEINSLKTKISELGNNIEDLKKQLLQNLENNQKMETLNATLEELSKEIENLKLLKEEFDNLKNRVNTMSFCTISQNPMSVTSIQGPALPPPPPPPPPPLPPLLPQVNKLNIIKKITGQSKAKNETPRPMISLDDILKVKLKKTSDRSVAHRRSTGNQPEITKDMLQQVKLRKPVCRSMTPSRLPDLSPEGSTSPHSSLRRLLKDDGSFRIKRLRRVDGYTFKDSNKKNKFSRERQ